MESAAEKIRTARSQLRSLEHQQELDQQQRSWLSREVEALTSRLSPQRRDPASVDLDAASRALSDINARLTAARSERDSRERAQAQASARHERALAEIESVRAQAKQLVRRWKANAAYLHLSASDEQSAQRDVQQAEAELSQAEQARREIELRVAEACEASDLRNAQHARLNARLKEIDGQISAIEQADAQADTLRALVRSRIDDAIRADAIFGELMDAALYDDLGQAILGVARIVEADAGRTAALVRDQALALIDSLMSEVECVADIEAAKQTAQSGRIAVTPDGILVRPDGVVLAGGSQPGARRLQQQLLDLRSEQDDLAKQLQATATDATSQQSLEDLAADASRATERMATLRRTAEDRRLTHEQIRRRRASTIAQRRSDAAEIGRLRSRLRQAQADEQASTEHLASSVTDSVDISALEQERDRRAADLAEARAQAAARDRDRADRTRLFSLRRELEDVETAIREREPQLEAAASMASDTGTHQVAEEHLGVLETRRSEAARSLEQAQQLRLTAERQDVEAAAALRETESARARLAAEAAAEGIAIASTQRGSQPRLKLNGADGAVHLASNASNGAGAEIGRGATTAVAVAEPPVSELKQTVADLRAKLQRLGPVDPGAAQEFAAERERWQGMEAQIEDLESTESALRQAERDLEALIERKFREARQQVDQAFRHYFQLMFRGGHAELALTQETPTEDEDMESQAERPRQGVEIRASRRASASPPWVCSLAASAP